MVDEHDMAIATCGIGLLANVCVYDPRAGIVPPELPQMRVDTGGGASGLGDDPFGSSNTLSFNLSTPKSGTRSRSPLATPPIGGGAKPAAVKPASTKHSYMSRWMAQRSLM